MKRIEVNFLEGYARLPGIEEKLTGRTINMPGVHIDFDENDAELLFNDEKGKKLILVLDVEAPNQKEGGLEKALIKCPKEPDRVNPKTGVRYSETCMFYRTPIYINRIIKLIIKDGVYPYHEKICGTKLKVKEIHDYDFDKAIGIILDEWVKLRCDPKWLEHRVDLRYIPPQWVMNRIESKTEKLIKAMEAGPEKYEAWMAGVLDSGNEKLKAEDRYRHITSEVDPDTGKKIEVRVDYAGLDFIIRKSILKIIAEGKREIKPQDVREKCVGFYMNEQKFYLKRDIGRIIEVCHEEDSEENVRKISNAWGPFKNGALTTSWRLNYLAAVDYMLEKRMNSFYVNWAREQIAKKSNG